MDKAELGSSNIARLLYKQSAPAMAGLVALALCQIMDTVFIGRWVGVSGVAAVTVAAPFILLFAAIGRCLGSGGASIIGRANGAGATDKIYHTGVILVALCSCIALSLLGLIYLFHNTLLGVLAGKGELYVLTKAYLAYLLPGLPCLSFAILANNMLRSMGRSQQAMIVLLSPAIANGVLDFLFIVCWNLGLPGAAMATTLAYILSASYSGWCVYKVLKPHQSPTSIWAEQSILIREVFGIGLAPLVAQLVSALLIVVINAQLYRLGGVSGEMNVASHGIVQRLYTLSLFPLIGLCQGFLPICGYNIGAGNYKQLRELTKITFATGVALATMLSLIVITFSNPLITLFTPDQTLIAQSGWALKIVMLSLPMVAIQLVCSCYYQASGNGLHTVTLTLIRQGAVHLPLVLLLPFFYQINGVWYAYPLASGIGCCIAMAFTYPKWKTFVLKNTFPSLVLRWETITERSTLSNQAQVLLNNRARSELR